MAQVYKLNIDSSDLVGALSAIKKLQDALEETNEIANDNSISLTNLSGKFSESLEKLKSSLDDVNDKIGGLVGGFGKVLSKIKSLALFAIGLGGPFAAAAGTNKEVTEGAMSKIGWAGARAYENASSFTGFSPSFQATQEALNTGYLSGTFAPLGMDAKEVEKFQKMSGDKAYFGMVDKFSEKLKELTSSLGEFQGQNVFNEVYGESLSNILGMSSSDFINAQKGGLFSRFKSTYYNTQDVYKNMDTKSLIEGERAFNKFTETIKASALALSSKVLPGLTKALNSIQGVFASFNNWLNTSKIGKNLSRIFTGLIDVLEKLFGWVSKVFDSIASNKIIGLFEKATGSAADFLDAVNKGDKTKAANAAMEATSAGIAGTSMATASVIKSGLEAVVGPISEDTQKRNEKMFNDIGKSISDKLESWFGSSDKPKIEAKVDNKLAIDIKVNGKQSQTVSLIGNQGKSVSLNVGGN